MVVLLMITRMMGMLETRVQRESRMRMRGEKGGKEGKRDEKIHTYKQPTETSEDAIRMAAMPRWSESMAWSCEGS